MIEVELVEEEVQEEVTFPCLMKSKVTGKVVLMTRLNHYNGFGIGTVIVASNNAHKVGHHSRDWAIQDFEPLKGKVILENKYRRLL
jgi:hypothetical protein